VDVKGILKVNSGREVGMQKQLLEAWKNAGKNECSGFCMVFTNCIRDDVPKTKVVGLIVFKKSKKLPHARIGSTN